MPFNFRFDAHEIAYCVELAEVHVLLFGPEFIGRVEFIEERISRGRLADLCGRRMSDFRGELPGTGGRLFSQPPLVRLEEEDDAAIYFSSGLRDFRRRFSTIMRA